MSTYLSWASHITGACNPVQHLLRTQSTQFLLAGWLGPRQTWDGQISNVAAESLQAVSRCHDSFRKFDTIRTDSWLPNQERLLISEALRATKRGKSLELHGKCKILHMSDSKMTVQVRSPRSGLVMCANHVIANIRLGNLRSAHDISSSRANTIKGQTLELDAHVQP